LRTSHTLYYMFCDTRELCSKNEAFKRVRKCPYKQTFLKAVVLFSAFDVASEIKPTNICTHCAKTKLCNTTANFF